MACSLTLHNFTGDQLDLTTQTIHQCKMIARLLSCLSREFLSPFPFLSICSRKLLQLFPAVAVVIGMIISLMLLKLLLQL